MANRQQQQRVALADAERRRPEAAHALVGVTRRRRVEVGPLLGEFAAASRVGCGDVVGHPGADERSSPQ